MCRFPACRVNDSSFIWSVGAVSSGTESRGVAMGGRRKSRMDRVREKESPNFEGMETKKSENKRYCEPKERR